MNLSGRISWSFQVHTHLMRNLIGSNSANMGSDKLYSPGQPAVGSQSILVICHNLVLTGGLLRFERMGSVLRKWGHEVAFVTLAQDAVAAEMESKLPVLSLEQAASRRWDAVMVPGAGFPDETIEKLAVFKQDNFGVRVQHILNNQSRLLWFKKVNRSFAPHVVIFNNLDWPVSSFANFDAARFHVLLGAVDLESFRPRGGRAHPLFKGKWIVGGQASKNPQPLVEALAELPDHVTLRLFGPDNHRLSTTYHQLINSGRLELTGPLFAEDLHNFYQNIDCLAMTETCAGWSNIVAEAMASGVPVVCTSHGTAAFARHEDTALIVGTPSAAAIAIGLRRLLYDASLCQLLSEKARQTILAYSWDSYASQMLELIQPNGYTPDIYAPESHP